MPETPGLQGARRPATLAMFQHVVGYGMPSTLRGAILSTLLLGIVGCGLFEDIEGYRFTGPDDEAACAPECAQGYICDDGVCVFACQVDSQCPLQRCRDGVQEAFTYGTVRCDTNTGRCEYPDALNAVDCASTVPAQTYCSGPAVYRSAAGTCDPSGTWCVGGQATLVEACTGATTTICDLDGTRVQTGPGCDVATASCKTVESRTACGVGFVCERGECAAEVCDPACEAGELCIDRQCRRPCRTLADCQRGSCDGDVLTRIPAPLVSCQQGYCTDLGTVELETLDCANPPVPDLGVCHGQLLVTIDGAACDAPTASCIPTSTQTTSCGDASTWCDHATIMAAGSVCANGACTTAAASPCTNGVCANGECQSGACTDPRCATRVCQADILYPIDEPGCDDDGAHCVEAPTMSPVGSLSCPPETHCFGNDCVIACTSDETCRTVRFCHGSQVVTRSFQDGVCHQGTCEGNVYTDTNPVRCDLGCFAGACLDAGTYARVAAQTFDMGSPVNESGRGEGEELRTVVISRPFAIKRTEVTVAEYRVFDPNANFFAFPSCGDTCPATNVSWYEAIAFANFQSLKAGLSPCYFKDEQPYDLNHATAGELPIWPDTTCFGYRLPTEAEWELAARAGNSGPGPFWLGAVTWPDTPCQALGTLSSAQVWYCANSAVAYTGCTDLSGQGGPSCAGPTVVNAFAAYGGIQGAFGNVAEWVWDLDGPVDTNPQIDPRGPLSGDSRIYRGGSFADPLDACRAAARRATWPTDKAYHIGLRLVRTLPF